jgi:hypothetical protein
MISHPSGEAIVVAVNLLTQVFTACGRKAGCATYDRARLHHQSSVILPECLQLRMSDRLYVAATSAADLHRDKEISTYIH